jgi:hypothetical protein
VGTVVVTGPGGIDGDAVISLPDIWDVSPHREQLLGPIAAWSTSQAALSEVGPRHRGQVRELIPRHWSGDAASGYQRRSDSFTDLHTRVCGCTGLVATQFQELDSHLKETEQALERMWRRISSRVQSRRVPHPAGVEFLVRNDAQVQLVRQAIRDAQLVRRASSEFVRICRERIEAATAELAALLDADAAAGK